MIVVDFCGLLLISFLLRLSVILNESGSSDDDDEDEDDEDDLDYIIDRQTEVSSDNESYEDDLILENE